MRRLIVIIETGRKAPAFRPGDISPLTAGHSLQPLDNAVRIWYTTSVEEAESAVPQKHETGSDGAVRDAWESKPGK